MAATGSTRIFAALTAPLPIIGGPALYVSVVALATLIAAPAFAQPVFRELPVIAEGGISGIVH